MPKKKQVGVWVDQEILKILEEMKAHYKKEYIELSDSEAVRVALRAWRDKKKG